MDTKKWPQKSRGHKNEYELENPQNEYDYNKMFNRYLHSLPMLISAELSNPDSSDS